MNWTGKIVGFVVGYGLFGAVGAIMGLLLGHVFDLARTGANVFQPLSPQQRFAIQQAYFNATFLVMGHIAKADGRVSKDEIRAARSIMDNMRLDERQKNEAIRLFTQGKSSDFSLDHALNQLFSVAGVHNQHLYHLFIDIQFRAASADGVIGPRKQQILQRICQYFALDYDEFARFYTQHGRHHYQQSTGHRHGHQRQGQGQRQYQQRSQPTQDSTLNAAYKMLGVNKSTSDADVKKAYRKLMSANHPDKLISKGLPEEMIKLATQKTQEIKEAYDTICASRG